MWGEGSMTSRGLTEAAGHSGGVVTGSTVTRTCRATGGSSRQDCESSAVKVRVPSIACIRTASISGACGGNEARWCPDVKVSAALRVTAAVGTIWEASKLGGLNIKKCLHPRNSTREKSYSRIKAGSRPTLQLGKADDTEQGTGVRVLWDRRGMGPGI